MTTRSCVALVACLAVLAPAAAADWPQWNGPDRTGVSKDTGLLKKWPSKGPPLAWTFKQTGLGYSAPAVVGKHLYIMGARGPTEFVIALDADAGKELWAAPVGPTFDFQGNAWGKGPRSTPTVDGDHLYALGGQGELVCMEAAGGKKVWSHNLFKGFNGWVMDNNGPAQTGWGYVEGPLVDGDRVVVTPGGKGGTLIAFDKHTGKELWRTKEVTDKAPYSSIIVGEVGGVRHYIQMTDKGVVGVAPDTGKLLWRFDEEHDDLVIRTPIFHGGDVFTTVGMARGSVLVGLKPAGQSIDATKIYANKNMKNELGGVVLVGEHLYGYSDGKGWICQKFKKPGDIAWSNKRLAKGSVAVADGHLYCFTEDDGVVALVEANPKKWVQTGRFTIPQQSDQRGPSGKAWTHPVVANGRLYVRDQELLFCYDVRQGAK